MTNLIKTFCENYTVGAIFIYFWLGYAIEVAWTKYTQHVLFDNAHPAALCSVIIYLLAMLYTVAVVSTNGFLIGSFLFGTYIGTYITIKYGRK